MKTYWLATSQKVWVWYLRAIGLNLRSAILTYIWQAKENVSEEIFSSRLIRSLVPATFMQVLLAIVTVGILLVTDAWLQRAYAEVGWPNSVDDGIYGTLLGAVASMGGVFIGLYFAALTSVAASSYAKYPSAVRNLLSAERIGGVYIRALAYITCLSLLLLALRVLKYPPLLIAVPTISLLACVGVIAFVKLGQRVFSFFDPVQVSDFSKFEIAASLKVAEVGGLYWSDPSFQSYAQRRTLNAINAIVMLSEICQRETHLQDGSMLALSAWVSKFLSRYQKQKRRIPSESKWYPQIGSFKDIYRTDHSSLSIAHQTGTFPSGSTVPDHWWIEDRLCPVLLSSFTFYLKSGNLDNAMVVASQLERLIGALAEKGDIQKAVELVGLIVDAYLLSVSELEHLGSSEVNLRSRLALAQSVVRLATLLLLKFRGFSIELHSIDFPSLLKKIDWSNPCSPYEWGLPRVALPIVEDIKHRLLFEQYAEGRIVSPSWYMQVLIERELASHHSKSVAAFYFELPKITFGRLADKLTGNGLLWERAMLLSSQLEFESKLLSHKPVFLQTFNKLTANKKIEGLEWPEFDEEAIDSSIDKRRAKLLREFPRISIQLEQFDRPNSIPDFSGQFLHESGEALIESLLHHDVEFFQASFKAYFFGAWLRFQKLRPSESLPSHAMSGAVSVALSPLFDLMDLSGYAYLISELKNDRRVWEEVKSIWDEYLLGDISVSASRIQHVSAMLKFAADPMTSGSRSLLRTQWGMRVSNYLHSELKLDERGFSGFYGKERVDHPSALVRIAAEGRLSMNVSGYEIFSGLYFSDIPTAEVTKGWRDIKGRVRREQERSDEEET